MNKKLKNLEVFSEARSMYEYSHLCKDNSSVLLGPLWFTAFWFQGNFFDLKQLLQLRVEKKYHLNGLSFTFEPMYNKQMRLTVCYNFSDMLYLLKVQVH